MIIGNNNNFNNDNNNFNNKFRMVKEEGMKNKNNINPFGKQDRYKDINNRETINDKAFTILEERYKNGLISIEEFNKKCNQLNKMRQK